jgi:hypothetical protein
MPYIESSLPPYKVWIKESALYDGDCSKTELLPAVLCSIRVIEGENFSFQVLLQNGVLRDKVNVSEIFHTPIPTIDYPHDVLQLWDCFSYHFTLVHINYLCGSRVDVYLKNREIATGTYVFTVNWANSQIHTNVDLTLAEDPAEHKSAHFIMLDSGQFAIQPNNRLRFYEPSFVTKEFPEKPDYKVNTRIWKSESEKKWRTENSDSWAYEIITP